MLRCMLISGNGEVKAGGEELIYLPRESGDWLWLDLQDEPEEEEFRLLNRTFNLDALAIQDAQRDRHPPKLEVFDHYLFLLLKGLHADTRNIDFVSIQIAMFVAKDFLVTRHSAKSPSIDRQWDSLAGKSADAPRGPLYWCCKVARTVADRYGPVLLELEERLDQIEDDLFDSRTDALMEELVNYNTQIKKLRRILAYHVNIFSVLRQSESWLDDTTVHHEFVDVHEQMERYASLSGLYQELISDLINGYISLNGHHLNQIMKVLTIVTVIFVPLTLLVGIYGMNFEHIPELKAEHGYQILIGVMLTISVSLLLLFRKIKWL